MVDGCMPRATWHDAIRPVSCCVMEAQTSSPRAALIDAARRLSAEGRDPTMSEIAGVSGISVRTAHRLFGTRAALLQAAGHRRPTVRGRVLEAALEAIGRRGVSELSMDELAAQAGISRPTLYRLFRTKTELVAEVIRAYSPWPALGEVVRREPRRPPTEVIPELARTIVRSLGDRTGLVLQLVSQLGTDAPGADRSTDLGSRCIRTTDTRCSNAVRDQAERAGGPACLFDP